MSSRRASSLDRCELMDAYLAPGSFTRIYAPAAGRPMQHRGRAGRFIHKDQLPCCASEAGAVPSRANVPVGQRESARQPKVNQKAPVSGLTLQAHRKVGRLPPASARTASKQATLMSRCKYPKSCIPSIARTIWTASRHVVPMEKRLPTWRFRSTDRFSPRSCITSCGRRVSPGSRPADSQSRNPRAGQTGNSGRRTGKVGASSAQPPRS